VSGLLVLGLDPSPLRLGWAVMRLDYERPLECGWDTLASLQGESADPPTIRAALAIVAARADHHGEVAYVAIERPWHGFSRRGAILAAETCGQVVQAVSRRWPHAAIERFEPAEWRRLAGLSGAAKKPEVLIYAESLGWRPDGSQDAADAAMIALAGYCRNAEVVDAYAAEQAEAAS
jgi:Holliday junction resolvasome RuvABC endonuclease subunit